MIGKVLTMSGLIVGGWVVLLALHGPLWMMPLFWLAALTTVASLEAE